MRIAGNDYNRLEFAGAFGDLGTLIPFVVGHITVTRLDPQGTLFRLFPMPVLGVILFFGGVELAVSLDGQPLSRADRTVLAVTAGIGLWNLGVAYLVGLLLYHANRYRIIRLE